MFLFEFDVVEGCAAVEKTVCREKLSPGGGLRDSETQYIRIIQKEGFSWSREDGRLLQKQVVTSTWSRLTTRRQFTVYSLQVAIHSENVFPIKIQPLLVKALVYSCLVLNLSILQHKRWQVEWSKFTCMLYKLFHMIHHTVCEMSLNIHNV